FDYITLSYNPDNVPPTRWEGYADSFNGKKSDNAIVWKKFSNNSDGGSWELDADGVLTMSSNADAAPAEVCYGVTAVIKNIKPETKYYITFKEKSNLTEVTNTAHGLYLKPDTMSTTAAQTDASTITHAVTTRNNNNISLHSAACADGDWEERTITWTSGTGITTEGDDSYAAKLEFTLRSAVGSVQIKDLIIFEEPEESIFKEISRGGWTVSANSERTGLGVSNAVDDNADTYWSTDWTVSGFDKDTNPYYIKADLGDTKEISRILYTPRKFSDGAVTSGNINGVLTEYELYGSNDDADYTLIVKGDTGFNTAELKYESKTITFPAVNYRYIKLVARNNLNRIDTNWGYQFCCAELKAYSGGEDLTAQAKEKLQAVIEQLNGINNDTVRSRYIDKANALNASDTVCAEEIERFVGSVPYIVTCDDYAENGGADAVYFGRLIDNVNEKECSSDAVQLLSSEIKAFSKTGAEVYEYQKKMFGNAFYDMNDEQKGMTLYARLNAAVAAAKAYLADKPDADEYVMLNELIGYVSDSDAYGMNAEKCEYIVNDIFFALDNLAKIDAGELDTRLNEIKSGELWLDNKGSKISAHGGQIIVGADGKYYWYGEDNKLGYSLTTGLSCYSSSDLKDWTYEGIALSVRDAKTEQGRKFGADFLTDNIIGSQGRLERPKVIYNEKTKKYVMWGHMENKGGYGLSAAGVAVADDPAGPFTWLWYGFPVWDKTVSYAVSREDRVKQTYRDCTLFVDEDGTAYTVYSSEENDTTYAVRLNSDYTWIDTGDDELAENITYTDGIYTDGTYNYVDTSDAEHIASGVYNYGLPSFTA
ncbi:MAG: discoidin domain-containing protein, partial [Candidatus Ornithomonoglobus sp.]